MSLRALLLALAAATSTAAAVQQAPAHEPTLSVRITSPLGRTGTWGQIRVVAQIKQAEPSPLQPVRFFVDGTLLAEDTDGPPYAVPWSDDNPFEPRVLRVEAADEAGHTAYDELTLKPFEIIEEARVASVLLEAAVTDANGRFVTGMSDTGFSLSEDDVPQALEMVRSGRTPATYLLLVDTSQSMSRRIDFVREAALRLVAELKRDDRIVVAPFSKDLGPVTGPTDDRDTVVQAIEALQSEGGTAIADSIHGAASILDGVEGRHAIVLITDGYDEHSSQSADESLEATRQSHSSLYVLGVGGVAGISLKGEKLLRRMAADTGGKVFFPQRVDQLAAIHDLIATEVENRYLIAYTPTNQKLDGSWRRIALETVDPTYMVRTRPGYFAPAPPPIRASIEFTLTDRNRQFTDVSAEDLEVVENGEPQTIESFQEAISPVSIVVALDASGSMRRAVDAVKDAARRFVEALRPEDKLAVAVFNDEPMFAHELTANRATSLEAISQYQIGGGTALYDTIAESLLRLKAVEGRRVVVVLTDGRDENNPGTGPGSLRTFPEVEPLVREAGATVFTIGLGTNVDRDVLERLAALSGGEAAFPTDPSQLDDQYRRIVENLRRRWIVNYLSTHPARDGEWREVEIRVRRPEILVQSAGGYFAPEK